MHIGIIVAILERLKKGHKWNGQETIYDLNRILLHEDIKPLTFIEEINKRAFHFRALMLTQSIQLCFKIILKIY